MHSVWASGIARTSSEQNGWTVPTTFAEQEELCGKMKEAGMYCVSLGGKFGWHTMRVLDYFLEHHLWARNCTTS